MHLSVYAVGMEPLTAQVIYFFSVRKKKKLNRTIMSWLNPECC